MSRIGKFPIPLPPKVEVTLGAGEITVKGPLGTLTRAFGEGLSIEKDGDRLVCVAANESVNAMHGTLRALVANMVKGVTDGFSTQAHAGRRRLPRAGRRRQGESVAGLFASGRPPAAEGRHGRRRRCRPRSC